MPRNGSGVYSLPAGLPTNGETSNATDDILTPFGDVETDLNTPRPIVAGGTGASSASGARTNLGLAIGSDVQGYDAALASIAGLTTVANRGIYTTASDTYAVFTLTSAGRALLDDADAAAQRTTLGLGALAVEATVSTALIDDDAVTAAKLADTAVTPGSYTNASVTVDQQGRVTAASSGSSGGWQVVERVTGSATSTADLSAYRAIKFNFSCNTTAAQTLSLQARDGAGTWRTLANGLSAAGSNDMYLAWGEISNFNDAAATDRMIAVLHTATTTLIMDTTAFDNVSTSAETAMGVSFRASEVWDAMRLTTNSGSLSDMELVIEGIQ